MRTALPRATAIAALVLLGACNLVTAGGDSSATDTNMKSVEIQEGTASDEMILLDQSNVDGTAVDPSTASGPPVPVSDAGREDEGDDATASRSSGSSSSSSESAADAPAEKGGSRENADSNSEEGGE